MIISALFDLEQLAGRWTHEVEITYADLAALAAGNTGSFAIASLGAGDVFGNVYIYVKTAFTFSDASVVNSPFTIGDSTSATTDLSSTETISGSSVLSKVGTSWRTVATSDTINVYFTGTAAHNLNTATAGELHVFYTKATPSKDILQ